MATFSDSIFQVPKVQYIPFTIIQEFGMNVISLLEMIVSGFKILRQTLESMMKPCTTGLAENSSIYLSEAVSDINNSLALNYNESVPEKYRSAALHYPCRHDVRL